MSEPYWKSMTIEERLVELEHKVFPERYCTHEFAKVPIDCPDGRLGCAVAHYGIRCKKCGAKEER